MHEGERPGGLTALAVINFIFGGFGALGILMMVVLLGVLGAMPDDPDVHQQMREALEQAGPIFLVSIVLGAISTLLLILSGVGTQPDKGARAELGRPLDGCACGGEPPLRARRRPPPAEVIRLESLSASNR